MKYGVKKKDRASRTDAGTSMRTFVAAILMVLLFGLYMNGNLDHTLFPLHMNKNECARNGYGAVFCGDELTQYRQNLDSVGVPSQ